MHYLQAELHDLFRKDDEIFNFLRESSLDGMWYWDLEKPENEWMSPEFWRLFGFDHEKMPHSPDAWQDVIHPDDLQLAIENFEMHLADPNHPYDQIVRYRHNQTGQFVTVRCRGIAIRNDDGKPIRMLGAHTDLTALKETEQKLLSANAELAEARDNAESSSRAKTVFLETMSHEIRTPMNGIVGMIDALMQTQMQPNQKQMANVISKSARSLLVLLNDVLDFSRIEAGTISMEYARFQPRDVLNEVIALFEATAHEQGIELVMTMSGGPPRSEIGSARAVRQVLTNLVSNALKFSPNGSKVIIEKRVVEDLSGRFLEFSVEDQGQGVSTEDREKIFSRFVQLDKPNEVTTKGTGLGLTISRKLCELHNGELKCEDPSHGVGARFVARFRLKESEVPSNETSGMKNFAVDDGHLGSLSILVAEDNELNRLVMEAMLSQFGTRVAFAKNGLEALEMANHDTYDAALVDIRMPVMSGLDFVAELRSRERDSGQTPLPLVACSANVLPHQVKEYLKAGFGYHLPKPVTMEALNDTLHWIDSHRSSSAA